MWPPLPRPSRATVRCALASLCLVASLAARDAGAQPTRVRLHYEVAEGLSCPDAATLRGAVERRLGYDPFDDEAPALVSASVERRRRGLRATLAVAGLRRGRPRRIRTATQDCVALVDAVAVSLCVIIDPTSLTRPVPPPPPPPPPPAPPLPPPAPPPLPPPPLPPPAPPRRAVMRSPIELRVRVGALWGMVPGSDVGAQTRFVVALGAGYRRGAFAVSAEVWTALPGGTQDLALAGPQRAQVTVGAFPLGVEVAPCWSPRAFELCGVVQTGLFVAHGEGYPDARSGLAGWLGLGARVTWSPLRLGRFVPYLFVEGVGLPLRPQLHLTVQSQDQQLWQAPPFTAAAGLGLRAELF